MMCARISRRTPVSRGPGKQLHAGECERPQGHRRCERNAKIGLDKGLRLTVDWYRDNVQNLRDRLIEPPAGGSEEARHDNERVEDHVGDDRSADATRDHRENARGHAKRESREAHYQQLRGGGRRKQMQARERERTHRDGHGGARRPLDRQQQQAAKEQLLDHRGDHRRCEHCGEQPPPILDGEGGGRGPSVDDDFDQRRRDPGEETCAQAPEGVDGSKAEAHVRPERSGAVKAA
jgi:hypothetical protein